MGNKESIKLRQLAFPNNRCLICTLWQMPVNAIVSHIQLTALKPLNQTLVVIHIRSAVMMKWQNWLTGLKNSVSKKAIESVFICQ
jgi:hypothetical protein